MRFAFCAFCVSVLAFCVSESKIMVCVLKRVLVLRFGLRFGDFPVNASSGSCVLNLLFEASRVNKSEIGKLNV